MAGLLTGARQPRSRFSRADAPGEQVDFFDAKGVVETVLRGFNIRNVSYKPVEAASFHPGRAAAVVVGDQLLGVVGELHPRVVAAWDLPDGRIGAFDLDMAVIEALGQVEPRHAPPSRYPATMQDLAVVVPDAVPAARVEARSAKPAASCWSASRCSMSTPARPSRPALVAWPTRWPSRRSTTP